MTDSSTPSPPTAALIQFFFFLSILPAGGHLRVLPEAIPTAALSSSAIPTLTGNPVVIGDAPVTLHRRSLLTYRILAGNGASKPPLANPPATSPAAAPGPSPSASSSDHRHNLRDNRKIRNWIIRFAVGSLFGVLTGLAGSFLFHLVLNCIRGRYRHLGGVEIFSLVVKNKDALAFLETDGGLADLEVIGRGASGVVYRKEITNVGGVKTIAIKQVRTRSADVGADPITSQDSRQLDKWMRQIRSEIRTVGRIRHRNLLPLIAHVARPDCHYLVYEYMKNGSLHDVLRDANEGRREFGWSARLRVAIGIATGLEHLHVHHKPHIVHRDLKPANVLLDDGMDARISDFGLAQELPDAHTHMSTRNIAGTIGYIAPEYYQTMKFTTKCDIYSFGVILAVMVMGRFPSDNFFEETDDPSLVKWMRNRLGDGNTAACFDGKLAGRGHDDQLELALKIACFCSADDPKERPSSKEVRLMLGQIGGN